MQMICIWEELLGVLPPWLRPEVDARGREGLRELRLRRGQPPQLILRDQKYELHRLVSQQDLDFCINAATRYSPWNAASASMGYLTIRGGHRIGICGESIFRDGISVGVRNMRSLCIRVARDITGISGSEDLTSGSALIIGAPGWGKTTLLRDLIRRISQHQTVSVIDERQELFPDGFDSGKETDILTGCSKAQGILQALRTMGPEVIAVDEITAPEDCRAVQQADYCGVRLLATAHAGSLRELRSRELYREILPVFDLVYILQKDQTYRLERMTV